MDQCYFNGNYYQATAATTPGQSPEKMPASWSLIPIPANWRWVLSQLTYANLLEMDGQKDKAAAERQGAIEDERRGLHQMILNEANRERGRERPEVVTRR